MLNLYLDGRPEISANPYTPQELGEARTHLLERANNLRVLQLLDAILSRFPDSQIIAGYHLLNGRRKPGFYCHLHPASVILTTSPLNPALNDKALREWTWEKVWHGKTALEALTYAMLSFLWTYHCKTEEVNAEGVTVPLERDPNFLNFPDQKEADYQIS